ncbi:hypothetical protein AGMMS50267_06170 [Spirochaetia bacterium]|nr:hypothetical protein AGMMS50267_06170 [Spirochaetia bacterium]
MSRSYRKFPSYLNDEFCGPKWRKIRGQERRCVFDEMKTLENGDVIFPRYHAAEYGGPSSRDYYPMKTIWDRYITEIRNILNEYSYDGHFSKNDFKADFIENFGRIKNGQEPTNFDWIKINKIRKIIKAWNGEPIDVLYYLNHHRIIEQAANIELKRMLRK